MPLFRDGTKRALSDRTGSIMGVLMLIDERMADLAKLLDVASQRQKVHAGNIANANTPGYRARAVQFEEAFQQALANGDGELARSIEPEIFEPRTTSVDNDGNDVSVDRER